MGKYSSESDSSDYQRKKKSGRSRNRSSSHSSSSSRYSSRSKKSKKSTKKYKRSRSPDRYSRNRRKSSRDRSSSRHRTCRRSEKRSKRRSRSNSNRSSYSRNRDRSYSKDRKTRSPSSTKHKRSRSPSLKRRDRDRDRDKKSPIFDSVELLERLNKAASQALSDKNKKIENLFSENPENRSNIIDQINAPNFIQESFSSKERKNDVSVVTEPSNFISFNNTQLKEEPGSLLHPNLLIEDENDKLNRWIRKLYLIRQKSIHGEPLMLD